MITKKAGAVAASRGVPFRDAYQQAADPAGWIVGDPAASLHAHVSPGSAGMLCLDLLRERLAHPRVN
ncbi:MAG: hypothetical protein M3374_01080 [Pseudomonadota bacterium]|nr:hypothetical protein [Pseudomonadota bacterium]